MTDWEAFYDQDEERYRFEDMTDVQIMGLGDGYDDGRIDAVIAEFLRLRSRHEDRGVRNPSSPGEQEVSG